MIELGSLLIRQSKPDLTAPHLNAVVERPPHFWVGEVRIPSAREFRYLGWVAKFHSHWKTLVQLLIVEKSAIPIAIHAREIHQDTVLINGSGQ